MEVWPPRSWDGVLGFGGFGEEGGGAGLTQTLKLRFLYVTDSTLNPIVGIVVTTSPI